MPVRAAFLSAAMLLALSFGGLAVYTENAHAGKPSVDGYGITIRLFATAG